jgi:probable F420-dependent oxidoreductase
MPDTEFSPEPEQFRQQARADIAAGSARGAPVIRRPVGLVMPNNEPGGADVLQMLPVRAEQWGYDSVWVTDHVIGVQAMSGVYGSYWLEALTALTWAAARTSTIRLGTGILVVPHRDPVLTAKMISTLDVLSGGRVDLGIGTGWSRVEFRSLGVQDFYSVRGRVTNEALEIICRCWEGGEVAYSGEFFDFRHIEFAPTPAQRPRVPIWVGGDSAPALQRAARFADVWHPHDITPVQLRRRGEALDQLAGRAVARSVRLGVGPDDIPRLPDLVDEYVNAGSIRVVIEFRSQPSGAVAELAERAAKALFS